MVQGHQYTLAVLHLYSLCWYPLIYCGGFNCVCVCVCVQLWECGILQCQKFASQLETVTFDFARLSKIHVRGSMWGYCKWNTQQTGKCCIVHKVVVVNPEIGHLNMWYLGVDLFNALERLKFGVLAYIISCCYNYRRWRPSSTPTLWTRYGQSQSISGWGSSEGSHRSSRTRFSSSGATSTRNCPTSTLVSRPSLQTPRSVLSLSSLYLDL